MKPQPWTIFLKIFAILTLIQTLLNYVSISEAYRISSFPGQPQVQFQQYSGYITVDESQKRTLFYYFVEAEKDTASKPLVLWLNGGPGCSSIGAGAFCEHGPFKPSGDILLKNEYSWNKAQDNLEFLKRWFIQFPNYKNREFFITGESYAGHYVPQLAQLIIQSKADINLKGIAIGNPLLEFDTDFNSRAEYIWSHGIISDSTYEIATSVCNYSTYTRQVQVDDNLSPLCSQVWRKASKEMSHFIDTYGITLDICLSSVFAQSAMLNKLEDTAKIDVCVGDETMEYLNRKDVQKAFHAELVGVKEWTVCSDVLKYDMKNLEIPTIHVLGALVKSGIPVLIYSGDQDSVIPLTGSRTLVTGLAKELGLNTTVPYRAWFEGKQVAGWTQVYGNILSYATIRGGSHEAPFSQPERSLVLFNSFVAGKPLPEAF